MWGLGLRGLGFGAAHKLLYLLVGSTAGFPAFASELHDEMLPLTCPESQSGNIYHRCIIFILITTITAKHSFAISCICFGVLCA